VWNTFSWWFVVIVVSMMRMLQQEGLQQEGLLICMFKVGGTMGR